MTEFDSTTDDVRPVFVDASERVMDEHRDLLERLAK